MVKQLTIKRLFHSSLHGFYFFKQPSLAQQLSRSKSKSIAIAAATYRMQQQVYTTTMAHHVKLEAYPMAVRYTTVLGIILVRASTFSFYSITVIHVAASIIQLTVLLLLLLVQLLLFPPNLSHQTSTYAFEYIRYRASIYFPRTSARIYRGMPGV